MEYTYKYDEIPQQCHSAEYRSNKGMVNCTDSLPFRHMHNNYEITLFETNSLRVINGGTEVRMETPCLLLHRPYTLHGVYTLEDVPCLRRVINFSADYLDGIALVDADCAFSQDLVAIRLDGESYTRLREIYQAFARKENTHLRPFLLSMILKETERLTAVQSAAVTQTEAFYISKLLRYVAQNYMEVLDSAALARRFGISVTKLNRDFRTHVRTTVHEFITRVRMEAAARFLLQDLPVAVVANRCGYASSSHFIRAFRACYGITPLQYARGLQAGGKERR